MLRPRAVMGMHYSWFVHYWHCSSRHSCVISITPSPSMQQWDIVHTQYTYNTYIRNKEIIKNPFFSISIVVLTSVKTHLQSTAQITDRVQLWHFRNFSGFLATQPRASQWLTALPDEMKTNTCQIGRINKSLSISPAPARKNMADWADLARRGCPWADLKQL